MPRFTKAIREKQRISALRRKKRQNEALALNKSTEFRLGMAEVIKDIRLVLEQTGIDCVTIEVDPHYIQEFNDIMYERDLAGYVITQSPTTPNEFEFRDKILEF